MESPVIIDPKFGGHVRFLGYLGVGSGAVDPVCIAHQSVEIMAVFDNAWAGSPATIARLDAVLATDRKPADRAELRRAWKMAFSEADEHPPEVVQGLAEDILAVASILHELEMDQQTLCAAILHLGVRGLGLSRTRIGSHWDPVIATLVEGALRLEGISRYRRFGQSPENRGEPGQAQALRKLLLAIVEDVRVVIITLAEQLQALRWLRGASAEVRRLAGRETLEIHAPLAGRLGVWRLKWELEDFALRFLEPATYAEIAALLAEKRADRERYIAGVVETLQSTFEAAGLTVELSGRAKHIYSIWRKMRQKGRSFSQLSDVRAVRVLTDDLASCYAALGVVHALWPHIPGEFDDYIAKPKENNYRSLHTAVMGPAGKTLEIQIRSHEMHQHAERGVAAHWRYKEGGGADRALDDKVAWLRRILEWKGEDREAAHFIDTFKAEVLEDRVYVMTPQGRVIDLPAGATALDFAYHVHTEVGHRCRGARVDGAMVSLHRALKSGEQVEILTTARGGPSRDWLNPHMGYLNSARARAKVRHWFKEQDRERNITAGREIFERERRRLGARELEATALLKHFNLVSVEDFHAAIGHGDITPGLIAGALQDALPRDDDGGLHLRATQPGKDDVQVEGVGSLLTQIARCCKPVPPEPIIGYITRGRGVTVHRRDCGNVLRLGEDDQERLIDVEWSGAGEGGYRVDVQLRAWDRKRLLHDVSTVLANDRIDISAMNTLTEPRTHTVAMRLTLQVQDLAQLSRILDRLNQLPNVIEARRSS